MYAVRQTATTNAPNARPELARKRKRTLPTLAPRSGKRRRKGNLLTPSRSQQTGEPPEEPELSLFDFVQHQAAQRLNERQLYALMWSNPGDGREGLHTLRVDEGPPGPPGSGTRPNGTVDVILRCTRCSAKASNTGNWAKLAKSQ